VGDAGAEALDKRFVALLDTNREDISVPLRGFIQRLATKDVPVDFRQLLRDLLHWNGEYTRRQWARDYWQSVADDDPA
jgi:CRISPR system Cascade subunit CasB